MKKLFVFLFVVALLAGGGVVVFFMLADGLTARAIERSLAFILEVDVSVGEANLSARKSTLDMNETRIGNPEGYGTGSAITIDSASATVDVASIKSGRPGISEIRIRGAVVTVEFEGTDTNLARLMESAGRFGAEDTPDDAALPIYIELVVVEDARVRFIAPLIKTPIDVPLPRFEVRDIGTQDAPVTAAEATTQVLRALLAEVAKQAATKLPPPLNSVLTTDVNSLIDSAKDALGGALKKPLDSVRNLLDR